MTSYIRAATIDDLPTIYSFELAYIQEIEPEREADWKNAIPLHLRQWVDNFPRLLAAEQAGQVVGHCLWQIEGDHAVLASLYVAPQARRCGVGRQLLAHFEADAYAQGFTQLALGVRTNNVTAATLYRQAGYQRTGKSGPYDDYEKVVQAASIGEATTATGHLSVGVIGSTGTV